MRSIADIRTDYKQRSLLDEDVLPDPIDQFQLWWDEAIESKIEEVNAMTLATVSQEGTPSARIVLLKGFNHNGFVYFTNYNSDKGKQLNQNPNVALCFHWKELERQVRIEGVVEKLGDADNDAYFLSRPEGSRLGAWASPQSSVIAGRHVIEENLKKYEAQFNHDIPRPPHWGGYIVKPGKIEFWQGRSNRLHDRILFTRNNPGWSIARLAP
jgi:pyridoxamine 5'-phosphate oxidase